MIIIVRKNVKKKKDLSFMFFNDLIYVRSTASRHYKDYMKNLGLFKQGWLIHDDDDDDREKKRQQIQYTLIIKPWS